MNRRTVLTQLAIFSALAVFIVGYALVSLLGVSFTNSPYPLVLKMPSGGGIFAGAEVAMRGVAVGKVSSVDIATDSVTVRLSIAHGTKIPSNSIAHVYDLSAVGEQYVDFEPPATGAATDYYHSGELIPASKTTTPPQIASVLYQLEQFVDSVNPQDLQVIGSQFSAAFTGTGPQLKALFTDAQSLISQLSATQGQTFDLIHNSSILLNGAAAHAGDFNTFASSLDQLTSTLAQQTPSIERLLAQAAPTTRVINDLLTQNASSFSVLLANLATLSQIQVARVPGLSSLLVAVPEFGSKAPLLVKNGKLQLSVLINQNQAVCNSGLPLTSPISGTRSPIVAAKCSTALARGAANAPRPSGDSTDSAAINRIGPAAQPARAGNAQVGTYNPYTGYAQASNGTLVKVGSMSGLDKFLGDKSWAALLLGPAD
jgi:phospholipid/cholesterol/gamma-HCH transport system substrate-binding protein